eukprot:5017361-Prymnesium_polylepis.1
MGHLLEPPPSVPADEPQHPPPLPPLPSPPPPAPPPPGMPSPSPPMLLPPPTPPYDEVLEACRSSCIDRNTCCNGQVYGDAQSGCQWGNCLQACYLLNDPSSGHYYGNSTAVRLDFCGSYGCVMAGSTQCGNCDHGAGPGVAVDDGCSGNCNDPEECLVGASLLLLPPALPPPPPTPPYDEILEACRSSCIDRDTCCN